MEFRRINSLPPYVFTIIDTLKVEARRAGEDVIDLGFDNPDLPSPDVAVSPGMGFGPGGEGYVRFALIENEQRIGQAVRNLKVALDRLDP